MAKKKKAPVKKAPVKKAPVKKAPVKKAVKKKKVAKKRVISKTEKKIRGKRDYQMQLRRNEYKNLKSGIEELEKGSKKKIGKNIAYFVPEKIRKDLNLQKKGYSTKQTILNAYYNKIYKLSKKVNELEDKLKTRFKFKEKKAKVIKGKKGDLILNLGFVWDLDKQIENAIFKNKAVQSVEGADKKTSAPEILDNLNELKKNLDSRQFVRIVGQKGIYRIDILNLETEKLSKLKSKWNKQKNK